MNYSSAHKEHFNTGFIKICPPLDPEIFFLKTYIFNFNCYKQYLLVIYCAIE